MSVVNSDAGWYSCRVGAILDVEASLELIIVINLSSSLMQPGEVVGWAYVALGVLAPQELMEQSFKHELHSAEFRLS